MSELNESDRSRLGGLGGNLATISIFVNFAGVAVLRWAMFTFVPG